MLAGLFASGILALNTMSATLPAAQCEALRAYNAQRDGVSLVVLQGGQIVCEDYPNGGAIEAGWRLASGTKSFSGVMAAAAVQDGLLSLDERVSDTLTAWQDDPNLSQITVAQLLSLTSGTDYPGHRSPFRLPSYDRAVEVAVSVAEPGLEFSYGSGPFQVFGAFLTAKLEAANLEPDPVAYLQRRVLDEIGIAPVEWRSRGGDPHLPFGASFTAREWAVFGQFILQGGTWDGEPLLDPDAFVRLFEGSSANPAYGLTWWLAEPVSERQRDAIPQLRRASDLSSYAASLPDMMMAAGAGRQRLYVIPAADMVVVRQANRVNAAMRGQAPDWSDAAFVSIALGD